MRTYLFTVAGVGLLLMVVYDVYATILHARGRAGPIGETVNRTVWRLTRAVAFRLPRSLRHKVLNSIGPLLLPLLLITYIITLLGGFALIYYPRMPSHFALLTGAAQSTWWESLYYSGITLTTVGYGDITPRSPSMRFTALVEAASGYAVISLAITYLLSVYSALERKRSVALSFYHQAGEGADVAGFITHHFVAGRFYGLDSRLRLATHDIQGLLESHVEHPVIHYFHPVEVYKSLPRVLFLVLETCTIIRSCLDEEEYTELHDHPDVRALAASARHVLGDLTRSLDPAADVAKNVESRFEESRRWEHRFEQTTKRLRESGIKTHPDVKASWEEYRAQREEWESQLYRFATFLGYDWDEVTGDRDLRYAADEEMEEPRPNPAD